MFPNGVPLDPAAQNYRNTVMSMLSMNPPDTRVNDKANNALYVPVQHCEELLDFLFPLGWSFEYANTQNIANEMIFVGELVIDCGGIKRRIVGAGAEPIQMKSGAKDAFDLSQKILNTLAKDFPNAKSEAFKNACRGLGNVFGRNLNRKNADKSPHESARIMSEDVIADLEACTDPDTLTKVFLKLPDEFQKDKVVVGVFKERKAALMAPATETLPL